MHYTAFETNLTPVTRRKNPEFVMAIDESFIRHAGFFNQPDPTSYTPMPLENWMLPARGFISFRELNHMLTVEDKEQRPVLVVVTLRYFDLNGNVVYLAYRTRETGDISTVLTTYVEPDDLEYDFVDEQQNIDFYDTIQKVINRLLEVELDTVLHESVHPGTGVILNNTRFSANLKSNDIILLQIVDVYLDQLHMRLLNDEHLETLGFITLDKLSSMSLNPLTRVVVDCLRTEPIDWLDDQHITENEANADSTDLYWVIRNFYQRMEYMTGNTGKYREVCANMMRTTAVSLGEVRASSVVMGVYSEVLRHRANKVMELVPDHATLLQLRFAGAVDAQFEGQ